MNIIHQFINQFAYKIDQFWNPREINTYYLLIFYTWSSREAEIVLYKKDLEAIFSSYSTCLPTSIKARGGVNVPRVCTVTVSTCWPSDHPDKMEYHQMKKWTDWWVCRTSRQNMTRTAVRGRTIENAVGLYLFGISATSSSTTQSVIWSLPFSVPLPSLLFPCCLGAPGTVALPQLLKMPALLRQAIENYTKKHIHLLQWNRLGNGLNGMEASWKQPMLTGLRPDSQQYLNVIVNLNTMLLLFVLLVAGE